MRYYRLPDGAEITAGQQFIGNDGVQYPAHWLDHASETDLTDHGITWREVADAPTTVAPTASRDDIAALIDAKHQAFRDEIDSRLASQAPAGSPTVIETREEVDPGKLRQMIVATHEEISEALTYRDGDDPARFRMLSKRAADMAGTLADARTAIFNELAAVKQ